MKWKGANCSQPASQPASYHALTDWTLSSWRCRSIRIYVNSIVWNWKGETETARQQKDNLSRELTCKVLWLNFEIKETPKILKMINFRVSAELPSFSAIVTSSYSTPTCSHGSGDFKYSELSHTKRGSSLSFVRWKPPAESSELDYLGGTGSSIFDSKTYS